MRQHISTQSITSPDDPAVNDIKALYLESFPVEEQRPWQSITGLISDPASPFKLTALILPDGNLAGFATTWTLDGFLYIEHLAVNPSMRGNGIGADILEFLEHNGRLPLLLEVEPPETGEMASRRIEFYKRCGFLLHDDIPYQQPPYSPGLPPLRLILMSTAPLPCPSDTIAALHSIVYGYTDRTE